MQNLPRYPLTTRVSSLAYEWGGATPCAHILGPTLRGTPLWSENPVYGHVFVKVVSSPERPKRLGYSNSLRKELP